MEKSANYIALEAIRNELMEKQAFAAAIKHALPFAGNVAKKAIGGAGKAMGWIGRKLGGNNMLTRWGDKLFGNTSKQVGKTLGKNYGKAIRFGTRMDDAVKAGFNRARSFVGNNRGKLGLGAGLVGGGMLLGRSGGQEDPAQMQGGAAEPGPAAAGVSRYVNSQY